MRVRLLALSIALAACKPDAKAMPALSAAAPIVDAPIAIDAPIAAQIVVASAAPPAARDCPPSAYRNDGWSIRGVIPFVFPGCPPPELDLDVAFCATCARPCGYARVTAIDGEPGDPHRVNAYYDDDGRIVSLSTDLAQRFDYDDHGALVGWHQGVTAYTLDHDAAGRIIKVVKLAAAPVDRETWTFHHDAAGRVIDTVDPFGSTLTFGYDAAGRQIAEDDAGDRATFRYDANGRLIHRDTNWRDTLTYDRAGRLTTIASGSTRKRMVLSYDVADRLTRTVATGETGRDVTTTTYDYDCAP